MTGRVVISLDFELGWGHKRTSPEYVERIRQQADEIKPRVQQLLELFDDHGIAATWAVVGKLLEDGSDPVFSNPGLIECVQDSKVDHEIGLHTYAHQPFDDLTEAEAHEDISAGQQILSEYGITPKSFVFPQNRIAHLEVLVNSGIQIYRDELKNGWLPSLLRWPIPPAVSPSESLKGLVAFPGSLFIADTTYPGRLTRWRAAAGLQQAITTGQIVHFWLHPHNVITNPTVLDRLADIFKRITAHRGAGDIEVTTMAQAVGQ